MNVDSDLRAHLALIAEPRPIFLLDKVCMSFNQEKCLKSPGQLNSKGHIDLAQGNIAPIMYDFTGY